MHNAHSFLNAVTSVCVCVKNAYTVLLIDKHANIISFFNTVCMYEEYAQFCLYYRLFPILNFSAVQAGTRSSTWCRYWFGIIVLGGVTLISLLHCSVQDEVQG